MEAAWDVFRTVAFNGTQKTKLTYQQYDQLVVAVCQFRNDELFKDHTHKATFLETDLQDWPIKVKKFATTLSIKDCASVAEELKRLVRQHGAMPRQKNGLRQV